MQRLLLILCIAAALSFTTGAGLAEVVALTEQTMYVPVYSHIYHGVKAQPFDLTVTLSVRNTSFDSALSLVGVDYYDTDGKLIRRYATQELRVAPLTTKEFFVEQYDRTGGSGAAFVVHWRAAKPISPPLIETIMIGSSNNQGISFTSRGVEILH